MADGCCARSCVVKKKFYKRELQKWAKNALYLVGLERVAKEVIGHKKWQRLSVPFGDSAKSESTREAVDWTPNEKCIFCVNRQDESDLCSVDGASNDEGSRAGSPWSLASNEPLDLSVGSKARHFNNGNNINGVPVSFLKVPRIPEKSGRHQKRRLDTGTSMMIPISLHNASTAPTTNSDGHSVNSAAAAAAAAALARRAYTDDELQLALRDIQDGKLGTRRAAILYGIPRSTLRNKVYKMTMERPDGASTTKCGSSEGNGVCGSSTGPPLTMDDLVGPQASEAPQLSASESLKRLLRNRMAERLESKRADQLKLPLLPDLIRKLSEERFEQECNRSRERSAVAAAENFILKIPSYKPAKSRSSEGTCSGNDVIAYSSQSSGSRSNISRNCAVNSNSDKGIGVALREIIAKSIAHRDATIPVNVGAKKNFSSSSAVKTKRDLLECPPSTSKVRTSNTQLNDGGGTSSNSGKKSSSGKRMRAKRGRYRNYDRDNLMEAVRAVRRGEMSVHRAGSYYGVPHSTLEYKVKERNLMRPKKRRAKQRSADGVEDPISAGRYSPPLSSKSSFVDSTGTGSSSGGGGDDGSSSSDEDSRKSLYVKPSDGQTVGGGASAGVSKNSRGQHPPFTMNTVPAVSAAAASLSSTTSSAPPLWPFALDFSSLNSSNFFASQMMRKLQEDAMTHAASNAADSSSSATNGIDNSRDALLLSVLIRNGLQIQATEATGRK